MRLSLLVGAIVVLGVGGRAHAQGVSVTVTTTPAGGSFAPKNVVAIWVEDAGGAFQKTIGRWAATRKGTLLTWNQKAGTNDTDAVSGATRPNHTNPITATWDLKDRAGTVVPDGTYTIRMELSDSNATSTAQLHEGTFTFVKSASPQMQTGLTNGGFNSVSITFSASAACNNGVVDPGETCDPPGSCPTTCAASADACMPNTLTGDATTCTAACTPQAITACTSGDGCCPGGCDATTDTDCTAGSNDIQGGCATAGASGPLLILLLAGGLVLSRRRRR